jgi:DNA-binding MarR family transcriptional regulator
LEELGNSMNAISRKIIATKGNPVCYISPALDKIILMVGLYERTRIKELASILEVTSGAITQEVITLENDGYLIRSQNPNDRRETFVKLTTMGETALKVIEANKLKVLSEVFAGLDDNELQALANLINRASNTITKGA